MYRIRSKSLLAALCVSFASLHASAATPSGFSPDVADTDRVLAPLAFVKFCMRQPGECAYVSGSKRDSANLDELDEINRRVNEQIQPRQKFGRGLIGNWAIGPQSGDCNDYAVTKRHELIRRGWASSALLLSDVETPWGEAHLVLRVQTSAGDVVLDNLTDSIRAVSATGYRWIKRQSAENPNIWIRTPSTGT